MIAAALLAACSNSKSPAEACAEAARRGVDAMVEEARGRVATAPLPDDIKAQMVQRQKRLDQAGAKMRAVFTHRCVEDRWSKAALGCYVKVTSVDELRACRTQLTAEQAATLQRDETDLLADGPAATP